MDTNIINRALIKLGEPPVSSTNKMANGESFKLVYDDVRKSLLSSYMWRFAIKTVELAPLDEKPQTNRKYCFQIPSDCLVIAGIGDLYKFPDLRDYILSSGERYVIMGDKIECCLNPLPLTYVADVCDTGLFSPWFREAFSARIAAEMAWKIHQNGNMKQVLEQDFATAIAMAMQNNDIIQDTKSIGDNSWISVREAWYGD